MSKGFGREGFYVKGIWQGGVLMSKGFGREGF